ncbi:MAG: site-specific integrase [Candidatus Omnitrophica bacterium]|nr:site-specific integrase [Candidatus Omnitrophota bacterium]
MYQTLQSFEDYLKQGKTMSTVKHALIYVRGFLYETKMQSLSQVKTQQILDYVTKLEGRSQARVNQAIWALRLFFKWANVPGLEFPRQKRPNNAIRPLADDEIEAIEHWIYMNTLEPILVRRHVLRLIFYTGLRVKDIMTLSYVDFKFTDESGECESTLEITKEGLNRKVAVSKDFSAELQHYLRWWPEDTNAFNVSVANMNYMCKYLNQYDILGDGRRVSSELYRVSFACRCLEQGMSLQELQKLMGHKNIRSTKRYLKLLTQKEIKSLNKEIVG